jgi:hypothetical protein
MQAAAFGARHHRPCRKNPGSPVITGYPLRHRERKHVIQGELITLWAQPGDDATRKVGEIGLFAKWLSREDIRKMNFNKRNSRRS